MIRLLLIHLFTSKVDFKKESEDIKNVFTSTISKLQSINEEIDNERFNKQAEAENLLKQRNELIQIYSENSKVINNLKQIFN